jgi:hypothetical protein
MKILLVGEYSGLNNELKNSLRLIGHDVTLAASNDFFKGFPTDINLGYGSNIYSYKCRQLLLPFLNLHKMTGFDIVHVINFYIFPRNPWMNYFLIKFLKNNNNIVTLSGAGDDPFFVKHSEETMRYSPIPYHEKYDRNGKEYYMRKQSHFSIMKKYMNYIDGVIPIMFEYYSTFCRAGFKSITVEPIPIPIDTTRIKFVDNEIKGGKVVFFHGLNRPGFKGTFLIEKSFSRFKSKYPNDVDCLIDGHMSFDKYISLISKVNVSLDQVFSYSLAMNPLYSMAQGKLVCGGSEPESHILYNGFIPPVYNLLPDESEINNVLEHILEDKNNIGSKSELSREFIEKYHNPIVIANKYMGVWLMIMNNKLLKS